MTVAKRICKVFHSECRKMKVNSFYDTHFLLPGMKCFPAACDKI